MVGLLTLGFAGLFWRFLRVSRDPDTSFTEAVFVREPSTLAPRIHLLGRLAPSVAYAIETSAGLVLIDSGLQPDGSDLIDQLISLKLDESKISAILLTHVHGDHTLGARYLRELTGAKIYAGQADCEPLRDGGPREAFFSTFAMEGVFPHGTQVDVELVGGEVLHFGDTRIEVIATPGHTPGSLCYVAQIGHQRIFFGGDTISSLIGDLGTYAAYLAPRYRGNARDYLDSLRKLRAMPAPNLILPGHPNDQGQPHSPRLSKSQWHELLDRGIQEMQALVARYDADGEDFLDGHPKKLLPGLYYLGDYKARAIFAIDTGTGQLLFDAPGDEGLAAFVSERLRKAGVAEPALSAVLLTSTDEATTAGLRKVTQTWDCRVVAPADSHAALRDVCSDSTQLMTPSDFSKAGSFSMRALPLDGFGSGATAYSFQQHEHDVLVSGTVPSTLGFYSIEQLDKFIRGRRPSYQDFARSLSSLSDLRPNLWLPAYPTNGQNANLYDDQWNDYLIGNLRRLGG